MIGQKSMRYFPLPCFIAGGYPFELCIVLYYICVHIIVVYCSGLYYRWYFLAHCGLSWPKKATVAFSKPRLQPRVLCLFFTAHLDQFSRSIHRVDLLGNQYIQKTLEDPSIKRIYWERLSQHFSFAVSRPRNEKSAIILSEKSSTMIGF